MILVTCKYETKPNAVEPLIEEIKAQKLLEGFRSQPGVISFDYYVPVDEDNVLFLVDIWEDDAAFTAHLTCETTQKFAAIKPKYIENTIFNKYEV